MRPTLWTCRARDVDDATDPVRRRRAQVARWTLLANRVGYVLLAVAVALFFVALMIGFSATMATLVVATLVASCVLLAPVDRARLRREGGRARGPRARL